MKQRTHLKTTLLAGLILVSFGGWLQHLWMHPVGTNLFSLVPFVSGIASTLLVPLLYLRTRTSMYGYLLNGMTVIIGFITMVHYSLSNIHGSLTASVFFLDTTFADILILGGKFTLGKALFDLQILAPGKDAERKVKAWRFPNMGWWGLHLIAMAIVYFIGVMLWR